MRRLKLQKTVTKILSSIMVAVVFCTFFFTEGLVSNKVNAASLITLSIKTDKEEVADGDSVSVSVIADNFPSIVSFGAIDFNFDEESVEFTGIARGELPESFELTYDETEIESGLIKLYGEDKIAITQLAEQASMIEDGSIEDGTELIDPAFNSAGQVVLLTMSFKVKNNSVESTRFFINNAKDFKESAGEFSIINLEEGVTVNISNKVSNDASITDLRLNGYDMTPEFSADNMIYEATINKEVSDVVVTAATSNSNSTIRVSGNTDLQYGNNTVMVEITAQDGYTKKIYYIIVNRPESLIPVDAGLVDSYGKLYLFTEFPADVSIPEGFVQTTRQIDGYDVPVFAREDVMSVIIYLTDENGEANLYFYNGSTRATTLYNADTIIKSSKILTPAKLPVSSLIPDGFTSSSRDYNGATIKGYQNGNGDFIAYFKDEDGKSQFFQLDKETLEFTEFFPQEKNYELEYRVLFLLFLFIAVVEGVLITFIALTISHLRKSRAVPRARRV